MGDKRAARSAPRLTSAASRGRDTWIIMGARRWAAISPAIRQPYLQAAAYSWGRCCLARRLGALGQMAWRWRWAADFAALMLL